MIIKEILELTANATKPVIKILRKNEHFKVIGLGLNKDVELKEHKTALPAKLFVLKGKVAYQEGEKTTVLNQYEEQEIPINVLHAVKGLEASLCILTQG